MSRSACRQTFLADLRALFTSLQSATGRKGSGQIGRSLGTARLKQIARQGVAAAKDLDICLRNHFRNQPDKLAAWATARHIERAPRRNAEEENPATPSGGSGATSGASTQPA